jgi:hypothetical protein
VYGKCLDWQSLAKDMQREAAKGKGIAQQGIVKSK